MCWGSQLFANRLSLEFARGEAVDAYMKPGHATRETCNGFSFLWWTECIALLWQGGDQTKTGPSTFARTSSLLRSIGAYRTCACILINVCTFMAIVSRGFRHVCWVSMFGNGRFQRKMDYFSSLPLMLPECMTCWIIDQKWLKLYCTVFVTTG